MAEAKASRRRARRNPVVELECCELRILAHRELNAIELTVIDPAGKGYRTWIGADLAPSAALHFCGATMRLIEADQT